MSLTISKTSPVTFIGDDISSAGYTDKEISLIGYCWQDSEAINQSKTSLAMHLLELKQEMDAHDPRQDSRNVKSRFWAAFEAGHLPYAGDSGRSATETCLKAAEFLKSDLFPKDLGNKLCNLAPATLYEISRLEGEAQKLTYKSIESSDFIGVAAVRLIAHESDQDVFVKLHQWISSHEGQAVTPKTIRALRSEVDVENQEASTATVDSETAEQKAERQRILDEAMERVKASAPERERQAKINQVREELERPERERQQDLEDKVRQYNSKLVKCYESIHDLLVFMQTIDRVNGTQYLQDMRQIDVAGLITVRDDLPRLKGFGEELVKIVQLANSCNPPSGIDMTTVDL